MHIHMHQEWKKEEKIEQQYITDNKTEIKYLRMNQQKDRMITM